MNAMDSFLILFGLFSLFILLGAGISKGSSSISQHLEELGQPEEPYYGDLRKQKIVWNWGTATLFIVLLFVFIGILAYLWEL